MSHPPQTSRYGEDAISQQQKNTILSDLANLHTAADTALRHTTVIRATTKQQLDGAHSSLGDQMIQQSTHAVSHLEHCATAITQAITEVQTIPTKQP